MANNFPYFKYFHAWGRSFSRLTRPQPYTRIVRNFNHYFVTVLPIAHQKID